MRFIFLALLLCLVPLAAHAEWCRDWTTQHTGQEVVFQTLLFIDTRLTIDGCERLYPASSKCEANPLVGRHPDRARMNAVWLGVGAGHLLISCLLPARWRADWNAVTVVIEGFAVMQWIGVGARFRF